MPADEARGVLPEGIVSPGEPLVEELLHFGASGGAPEIAMHAREVIVPLYKNRPPIRVTAPVPPHMHERLSACGWTGDPQQTDPLSANSVEPVVSD